MYTPTLSALDPVDPSHVAELLNRAALPRRDGRLTVCCVVGDRVSQWLLGDAQRLARTADLVGLAPDLPYAQLVVQTTGGAMFLFDIRRLGWFGRRLAYTRARLEGLSAGYPRAVLPRWTR